MRILILFLSAFCASAQDIMPPMSAPVSGGRIDTNPLPVIRFTTITIGWTPSISPNIESQIVYRSPTFEPYKWGMIAVLPENQTNFQIECTNPPMAFFALQAVNSNGLASKLP